MALRVLLADESVHIKQALQLALQDFAAIVQSVNVGHDVLPVAKKFKPDIIFADILLQKKNGYEVCADLKKDAEVNTVPVVLMWSGFMELDQDKYQACGAQSHIEKPFDDKGLRKVVKEFVAKTKTQGLSQFLSFPSMPDWQDTKDAARAQAQQMQAAGRKPPGPAKEQEDEAWNMDSFQPIESFEGFTQVDLNAEPPKQEFTPYPEPSLDLLQDTPEDQKANQNWVESSLNDFKLPIDPEIMQESDSVPVDHLLGQNTVTRAAPVLSLPEDSEPELDLPMEDFGGATGVYSAPVASGVNGVDQAKIEEAIKVLGREVIEEIAWKIIPDLAEQLIERELKRLLAERDAR